MHLDNKLLRILGISAKIATGIILLGVGFAAYRNFVELERTRLQIKLLKRKLAEPKQI